MFFFQEKFVVRNYYIQFMAFFQDSLGKLAPEKHNHSGKTNLDLLEQEIVSGSGISCAICRSEPCPRQITMPAPDHSVFTGQKCVIYYCQYLAIAMLVIN